MAERAIKVLRWIDAALWLPEGKLAGYAEEEDRATRLYEEILEAQEAGE